MKVAKFGGSSLADAEQIKKVCDIIVSDTKRRLIVVSAPGKRNKQDTKVTDLLINLANTYIKDSKAEKELENVITRFEDIISELGLSRSLSEEIRQNIMNLLKADKSNEMKFTDAIKAAGEDNSARIVAAYLKKMGYNANYINPGTAGLILSKEFGNAVVLPQSYENLRNLRDLSGILIFPGFFGYSEDGEIVTFPRGGSDITGSILAAAIDAELYENFTDVDSVFAVNPGIIENPQSIEILTYREMRELSYAGFSVFHEEALLPVYRKGIPVCIKNTNNPSAPGTKIVHRLKEITRQVVGIATDAGFCSIYISKYLMNREIGFGRKLLQILEEDQISYEHTPSGIDDISVVLKQKQMTLEKEKRILERIKQELEVDDVFIEYDMALIMVVGEGARHSVGIAARATSAFSKAGVNLELINQGSSEVSIMFGVKSHDAEKAVKALYNEFFN